MRLHAIRYERKRRGRDSNPGYRYYPVQRFSKPSPSATRAPLQGSCGSDWSALIIGRRGVDGQTGRADRSSVLRTEQTDPPTVAIANSASQVNSRSFRCQRLALSPSPRTRPHAWAPATPKMKVSNTIRTLGRDGLAPHQ